MRKIRAGLIGAGFVGPLHVEAVPRLGYVDVVAFESGSRATRTCLMNRFGGTLVCLAATGKAGPMR